MSNILITVNEQVLSVTSQPKIASEGVNEDYVIFTLDSNLSEYGLNAVFWKEGAEDTVYQSAVDANGKALVPWEVMDTDGKIYIGLCGVKDDIIYTSEVIKYRIVKGKYGGNAESTPPTPGIYEQMLEVAAAMHGEYVALDAKIDTEATTRATGDTSLLAQIAAERARIDALIAGGSSLDVETVLYTGKARYPTTTYTLAESVANFDYLDFYLESDEIGKQKISTIPVVADENRILTATNIPEYVNESTSNPFVQITKLTVSVAGTTLTVVNHTWLSYYMYSDGSGASISTWGQVKSDSADAIKAATFNIVKVVGRTKAPNTELEDIRTGYDGTTYNTAGAAVRGQITEMSDKIDNAILALGVTSMELLSNGNVTATFGGES